MLLCKMGYGKCKKWDRCCDKDYDKCCKRKKCYDKDKHYKKCDKCYFKKKHHKKCHRVDSNFYVISVGRTGLCSMDTLPAVGPEGTFLLVLEWGKLFISTSGVWVAVAATVPYIFHCEDDGTFYEVTPDKPAKNFNDVVCARKFDTLFDCQGQTFYTLTKIDLIPKGCELQWVEDCQIESPFTSFPLYANSDVLASTLVFDTWTTVQSNMVINGAGWSQSGAGVHVIPADGLYKLDFAVNLNTNGGPGIDAADNVEIKYFTNGVEVGNAYTQQLFLPFGAPVIDVQQLVSGSAILPFTLADTLEVKIKQTTNTGVVIQLNHIQSSITAHKVDKLPVP